jgi:hypothetical protein
MTKEDSLDLIVNTKGISPLTRNFVMWLYDNGYAIVGPEEIKRIDSALILAHAHGMG